MFGGGVAARYIWIYPYNGGKFQYINGNTPFVEATNSGVTSAVLAMAGNKAYRNGSAETGTLTAWGSSGTPDSIAIGCRHYGGAYALFWTGRIQAMAIYDIALDATQIGLLTIAMNAIDSGKEVLIFDGDSHTLGTGGVTPYPEQFLALISASYNYSNFGIGGQTIATMQTDAATQVDVLYASPEKSVVFAWGGTNDIAAGETSATVITRIQTYCAARKAAGFKVVVFTILPNGGPVPPDYETKRLDVNNSVRANYATYADALCDIGANCYVGDADDVNDTTYYQSDKIHLTNAGYAIVAALAKTAYDTL